MLEIVVPIKAITVLWKVSGRLHVPGHYSIAPLLVPNDSSIDTGCNDVELLTHILPFPGGALLLLSYSHVYSIDILN